MNISLIDKVGLYMRKLPVRAFVQALSKCDEYNIDINVKTLEAHYWASGNISQVVESMVFAKENNIDIDFMEISAMDLAGKHIMEVLGKCIETVYYTFDTYSAAAEEKIVGHCCDHEKVYAQCTITYKNPPSYIYFDKISLVHEHLSARISTSINVTKNYSDLLVFKSNSESKLLRVANDLLGTISKIELDFQKQPF